MLQTWTFTVSKNVFRCLLSHSLRIVFVFFEPAHSPYPRMIWILTIIPILLRRLWWWIAMALLVFEGRQRVSPFYHPSIHQVSLLRRPSSINIPFWVAWWVCFVNESGALVTSVTADNRLLRPIIHLSLRTQRTLPFLSGFPRAFWCSRWQSWWRPLDASRNQTHHWSWLRSDSFFTWFFLCSFRHNFRILCRTEMANVEKNTKRWFHSSRVKFPLVSTSANWFLVSINVFDLDFGVEQPIKSNSVGSGNVSHCRTFLPLMIILITASLSLNTYNKASWCEYRTFEGTKSTLSKTWITPRDWWRTCFLSRQTTGFSVLSWRWVVFPRTKTIRSHKSRAGIPSSLNPASKEMISDSAELCETDVCFLHFQLIGTCMTSNNAQCSTRSGLWVLKICSKIGVLKKSQPALFCGITHITILFVFTCVMNVRYQTT